MPRVAGARRLAEHPEAEHEAGVRVTEVARLGADDDLPAGDRAQAQLLQRRAAPPGSARHPGGNVARDDGRRLPKAGPLRDRRAAAAAPLLNSRAQQASIPDAPLDSAHSPLSFVATARSLWQVRDGPRCKGRGPSTDRDGVASYWSAPECAGAARYTCQRPALTFARQRGCVEAG